jgi:hypothetical protein
MLSRRDFLQGASALALTPQVERILEHHLRHEAPLLVPPPTTKRVFYMHRDPNQPGFRIVTDALPFPRRLKSGAAEGTRTPDPIITNDVLYQLSYSGPSVRIGPKLFSGAALNAHRRLV